MNTITTRESRATTGGDGHALRAVESHLNGGAGRMPAPTLQQAWHRCPSCGHRSPVGLAAASAPGAINVVIAECPGCGEYGGVAELAA